MSNHVYHSSEALLWAEAQQRAWALRCVGLFAASLCSVLASACTDATQPGEDPEESRFEEAAAMPDEPALRALDHSEGSLLVGNEIARHGVPAASYQDAFNAAVAAGYRPVWVDGFDVDGATYYNAVFRPASGVSWVARHGLTGAQYQAEFNTWTAAGLRLTNVDSYLSGGGIRYAAIFTNEPGPAWTAYHGVSEATHVSQFNTLAAQGFRPSNVSVVSLGGARYVTALWDKAAFGGWVGLHKIPAASYQTEFDTQVAAGRSPHYINAYTHAGAVYYSAVFSTNSLGASWVARHGLSSTAYQTEWSSLHVAGYLTKLVTGVDAGSTAAYAAIWVK